MSWGSRIGCIVHKSDGLRVEAIREPCCPWLYRLPDGVSEESHVARMRCRCCGPSWWPRGVNVLERQESSSRDEPCGFYHARESLPVLSRVASLPHCDGAGHYSQPYICKSCWGFQLTYQITSVVVRNVPSLWLLREMASVMRPGETISETILNELSTVIINKTFCYRAENILITY